MNELWVIEYDGVAQLGEPERYYAIEKAEESFGATPDKSGSTYQVVRYVADGARPMGRDAALKAEGFD